MADDEIVEAEFAVIGNLNRNDSSNHSFNELEIERLKTRRAEILAIRTKGVVDSVSFAVVLVAAFASCTMCAVSW